MGTRGEIFSARAATGRRIYFFNVKENRHGDVFLNIVESKRNEGGEELERHSVVVFHEDMDNFLEGFQKAIRFIKERNT